MTVCDVWLRRDYLIRHDREPHEPPCEHSPADCPPSEMGKSATSKPQAHPGSAMSEHRYPCTAVAPELLQPSGPTAGPLGNHQHACIHDAVADDFRLVEHQCSCGMTWVNHRKQMQVYDNRPPVDTYSVTETTGDRWGIWPIVIALAACAAMAALTVWALGVRG